MTRDEKKKLRESLCRFCKLPKEHLMVSATKPGTNWVAYSCRECNTKRFRLYRATERGRILTRKAVYKSVKKLPERQSSRRKVASALKGGVIRKEPCAVCFSTESEAHHPEYSRPLAVIWLCREHHADIHRAVGIVETAIP